MTITISKLISKSAIKSLILKFLKASINFLILKFLKASNFILPWDIYPCYPNNNLTYIKSRYFSNTILSIITNTNIFLHI